VVLLVADGMSLDAIAIARWYKGGSLAMDALARGLVRTHNADSPIADSAPAGTAFATGHKSHTGMIGVLPDAQTMPGLDPIAPGDERRPVANVAEAARASGMATGLVSTCEFMHATPAAFGAHVDSRKDYVSITEQIAFAGFDLVMGGGYKYLTGRADGQDMANELLSRGYWLANSPADLDESLKGRKGFALFAPVAMAYDMDRDPEAEPSIAEMTSFALDSLGRDPDGFFLMVEGSKIDWAAHANDPIGVISDVLAFDEAVRVALEFARKRGDTAVIVVSDHGNSGLTIGDRSTSSNYDTMPLDAFLGPLKAATRTGEGLERYLIADRSNAAEVLARWYGIADPSAAELAALSAAKPGSVQYAVGPMMASRAKIGFTTGGHTGEDTIFFGWSPAGDLPTGTLDNTDIAFLIAGLLGTDLEGTNDAIFAEASEVASRLGATLSVRDGEGPNPALVLTLGGVEASFEVNRDYAIVRDGEGERVVSLGSLIVRSGGKWWIPVRAETVFKGK
jgi:alkaline phosphatase